MNISLANTIRNLLIEAGIVHFVEWDKDEQVVSIMVFHRDEEGGAVKTVLTRDSLLSELGEILN